MLYHGFALLLENYILLLLHFVLSVNQDKKSLTLTLHLHLCHNLLVRHNYNLLGCFLLLLQNGKMSMHEFEMLIHVPMLAQMH